MSYDVVLTHRFERHWDRAFGYHYKIRPELAHKFNASIKLTLERIAHNPKLTRPIYDDYRYRKTPKFRFRIYFKIKQNLVIVHTLWHTSRSDDSLKRELRGKR